MTNSKSTKRSLFISSLSLLLCFAMLLGTTFAWFTDSVTSSNNKIVAGSLKVDLELLDKEEGKWNSIKENKAPIFDYDLWEPGFTDVKVLKIENEGTLGLKWCAKFVSEGKLTDLANVIDVYVFPSETELAYPADRDLTGYKRVGTVAEFVNTIEQTTTGTLLPKDKDGSVAYLGIALKMQETAGDEYQEMPLGGAFDIMILATQLTYEKDSFDDQYDADAKYPVVDAEKLAEAIEAGKDVKLEADIDLTETIIVDGDIDVDLNGFDLDASTNASRPFEMADGANLTINGGDDTIACGAYGLVNIPAGNDATVVINGGKYTAETDSGSFIKPRGDGEIKIVLNNVEYTDKSATGYAFDCTSYTGDNLSVEINGGKFESTVGLVLPEGSSVTGAEIKANNTKNMQPAVYATGDMTIENCTIRADKSHAVAVSGGATLTVKNCYVYAGTDASALAFQVFSSGGTINVHETTYEGEIGTTGKINTGCVATINIDGERKYYKEG